MEVGYWADIRGRMTTVRYILAHSGTKCKETYYPLDMSPKGYPFWNGVVKKEHLEQNPFANLPYLITEDGKHITQTDAIINYLGRKLGYWPKNDDDFVKFDMIAVFASDLGATVKNIMMEQPSEKKTEFAKNELIAMMKPFNDFLVKNDTAFIVGDYLTVVDFNVFKWLDLIRLYQPKIFDGNQALKVWFHNMESELAPCLENERKLPMTVRYRSIFDKLPADKWTPEIKKKYEGLPIQYWGIEGHMGSVE